MDGSVIILHYNHVCFIKCLFVIIWIRNGFLEKNTYKNSPFYKIITSAIFYEDFYRLFFIHESVCFYSRCYAIKIIPILCMMMDCMSLYMYAYLFVIVYNIWKMVINSRSQQVLSVHSAIM